MIRKLMILLIAGLIFPGLAMAEVAVSLGDCTELSNIAPDEPVTLTFKEVGIAEYDQFFKDETCVRLGVKAVTTNMEKFSALIRGMTGASTDEEALESLRTLKRKDELGGKKEELKKWAAKLENSKKAIDMLSGKVPDLISQGQSLVQSAPQTFKGPTKARKLPKVTKSLKECIKNLKTYGEDLKALAKTYGNVLIALKEITS